MRGDIILLDDYGWTLDDCKRFLRDFVNNGACAHNRDVLQAVAKIVCEMSSTQDEGADGNARDDA